MTVLILSYLNNSLWSWRYLFSLTYVHSMTCSLFNLVFLLFSICALHSNCMNYLHCQSVSFHFMSACCEHPVLSAWYFVAYFVSTINVYSFLKTHPQNLLLWGACFCLTQREATSFFWRHGTPHTYLYCNIYYTVLKQFYIYFYPTCDIVKGRVYVFFSLCFPSI